MNWWKSNLKRVCWEIEPKKSVGRYSRISTHVSCHLVEVGVLTIGTGDTSVVSWHQVSPWTLEDTARLGNLGKHKHVTPQRRWPPKKRPKCPTCFDFSHVCLVAPTRSLISIVSSAELERCPCAIVHIVEPVFLIGITHSQSLIGIELLGQMNNKNDFLVAQQFHKNEFKW